MKRISFLLFVALIALLTTTSCKKEVENTSKTIDVTKTATINGYVETTLNVAQAPVYVSGINVMVTVPKSQIDPVGTPTGTWITTVTTDASGKFTVNVPAHEDGVTVTIKPQDFEKAYNDGTNNNNWIFTASDVTEVGVIPNATILHGIITYSNTTEL